MVFIRVPCRIQQSYTLLYMLSVQIKKKKKSFNAQCVENKNKQTQQQNNRATLFFFFLLAKTKSKISHDILRNLYKIFVVRSFDKSDRKILTEDMLFYGIPAAAAQSCDFTSWPICIGNSCFMIIKLLFFSNSLYQL